MGVLGAVLVNARALEGVAGFLLPEHFALAEHRSILQCCLKLREAGELVDPVTVKSALGNAGALDQVGGPAYLNRLVDCAVTVINAVEYGRLVHNLYLRRELIAIGEEVVSRAYEDSDPGEQIQVAQEAISEASTKVRGSFDIERFHVSALDVMPLPDNDEILGEWLHTSSMVMVAGGEKSGKTLLLTQIARAAAAGDGLFGWESRRKARVLYLDYEVGVKLMRKRRLKMYTKHRECGSLYLMSYNHEKMPRLDSAEGRSWLLKMLVEFRPEVIIIDNIGKVTQQSVSDDITAKSVADIYAICHGKGCGVVVGHHTGWDTSRASGSKVFQNDLTASALMEKDETASPLTTDFTWKSVRDGAPGEGDFRSMRLRLNTDSMCLEEIAYRREGRAPEKLRWGLGLLQGVLERYGVASAGDGPPAGTSFISLDEWREAYTGALPGSAPKDADKELQALVREGLAGAAKGKIIWLR